MTERPSWPYRSEKPLSLWAKLGRSTVLAFTGLSLVWVTTEIHRAAVPPWRTLAWVVLEGFWMFWVLGLIHTWWQPLWLHRMLTKAQQRAVIIVWSLFLVFIISILSAAAWFNL